MSFTLNLRFTGMHLFVPAGDDSQMYALVPDTSGMGPGHAHHSVLRYSHDYGDCSSSQSSDCVIDLAGCELDLTAAEGGSFAAVPAVARLRHPVDTSYLGANAGSALATRIRFPRSHGAAASMGGLWKLDDQPVEMLTNQVTFVLYQVIASTLIVILRSLEGEPRSTFALTPQQGEINLYLDHLPADEPPDPNEGAAAPHFEALEQLCGVLITPQPVPYLWKKFTKSDGATGGSPYTCLAGQTTVP